ncbi:MAG TPA: hypothetical protein VF029_02930, partial [Actinomycetota bacterium]
GAAAAFCWQCFRPFPVRSAVPARAGTLAAPRSVREGDALPAPPPRRRPGRSLAAIAVTLAIVAGLLFFLRGGDDVRLPGSFAGLRQIQGEQVQLAIDQFRTTVATQRVEGDMGLYGDGGIPTAALVWVRDPSIPSTAEAFDALSGGFNTGLPGGIDAAHTTTGSVDGVEYVCTSIASVPPAAMCMWRADGVFWMLFDLEGAGRVRAAQDLSVAAHDAAR